MHVHLGDASESSSDGVKEGDLSIINRLATSFSIYYVFSRKSDTNRPISRALILGVLACKPQSQLQQSRLLFETKSGPPMRRRSERRIFQRGRYSADESIRGNHIFATSVKVVVDA